MERYFVKPFIFAALSLFLALPAAAQTDIYQMEPSSAEAGTTQSVIIYASVDCAFSQWSSVVTFAPATQITHGEISLLAYNVLETELTIPSNATPGMQSVRVTQGLTYCDGVDVFEVVCDGCGSATISSVTPVQGNTGSQLTITVRGAGTAFDATSVLSFSGSGISVDNLSAGDANTITATISIAADAPEGARSVTVTTGAEVASGEDLFYVVCDTCTHPALTQVQPATGRPDQTIEVLVLGQDTSFDSTSVLAFSGSGISVDSLSATDATTIAATITIAADAAEGLRNATVTTGTEVARGANLFEVICADCSAARLVACAPATAYAGQTLELAIVGEQTNFDSSSTLGFSGSGITVQTIDALDPTKLRATISVAVDASLGSRDLTVTTGNEVASGANLLAIEEQPFVVVPESAAQGDLVAVVTLTGGTTALTQVSAVDLGPGISIGSFNAPDDATLLLTDVAVAADAPVGRRDLTLSLPAGPVTLAGVFAVLQGPDTLLLSLDPAHGDRGHPGLLVDLVGQNTHFDADEVRISLSGEGVLAAFDEALDPTHMRARLVIADSSTEDARDVQVEAGGMCDWLIPVAPCERVTLAGAFSVTTPGTIDSAAPGVLSAESDTTVTLTATDGQFDAAETVLVFDPPDGLTATILSAPSSDQLQVQIQVSADAPGDLRDVRAVTGPEVAVGLGILDIDNPEIRSVVPSAGIRGVAGYALTIRGVDIPFAADTVVEFSGAGISVDSVSADPATPDEIQVSISIAIDAPIGYRSLTVRAGLIEETLERAFQVLEEGTPEKGGCGCDASQPHGSIWISLFVLIGLVFRRRLSPCRRG